MHDFPTECRRFANDSDAATEVFAQRVALFDFALKALRMQMQP